jgi:Transglycosylase SLT domain.
MRRIIVIVFCLCAAFIGRQALADDAVYAPLVAYPPIPATTIVVPTTAVSPVVAPTSEQPVAPIVEPSAIITAPVKMTAIEAVEQGKNLLAPVLADFKSKEAKVKPLASKTGQTAAALAIWNKAADTVTVYGGTRGAKYFSADNGGPTVPIVTLAGYQTAYRDNDPNTVVVGTVQAAMTKITVKKKIQYKPTFSYYVPYSSELYSPETLAVGSDYLSALIKESFDELDAKAITSRAFPNEPLTSVVDPYLIKSIAVVENADSQIYEDNNSEDALGRFLVKLALNKENALGNVVSSAGARGMVQFIPSTYKLMVAKRPDLALIPDFAKGMADHENAIKAEAAYLDMILADLPQSVRDTYLSNKGAAAEYIAAGYNGGSVRVKKAIMTWGDDWSVSHASDYAALTNKAASLKSRIAAIDKKLKSASTSAAKKIRSERASDVSARATALANAAKIKNT